MPDPRVSVLIDSYNYGRYIEQAIDSALAQRFPTEQMEVIVVDDGSTDDTAERLKKYGDRIRYIYKENGGQASALNAGVEASQGEFVAFLDSDDFWYPEKLQTVLEVFTGHPDCDVVYHVLDVVDAKEQRVGFVPDCLRNERLIKLPAADYLLSLNRMIAPTSGITMRRASLQKLMPIPLEFRFCPDAYLHRFAATVSASVSLVTIPLGVFFRHGSNPWQSWFSRETEKVRLLLELRKLMRGIAEEQRSADATVAELLRRLTRAEVEETEILLANLEGRKLTALRRAARFAPFPRRKSLLDRLIARIALVGYAILPMPLFDRIKRAFRKVVPLGFVRMPARVARKDR
jgi:glycosyltransferase involved in cell wall biosynthesis